MAEFLGVYESIEVFILKSISLCCSERAGDSMTEITMPFIYKDL